MKTEHCHVIRNAVQLTRRLFADVLQVNTYVCKSCTLMTSIYLKASEIGEVYLHFIGKKLLQYIDCGLPIDFHLVRHERSGS